MTEDRTCARCGAPSEDEYCGSGCIELDRRGIPAGREPTLRTEPVFVEGGRHVRAIVTRTTVR